MRSVTVDVAEPDSTSTTQTGSFGTRLTESVRLLLLTFEHPWFSGLIALMVYALFAPLRGHLFHASTNAYYNYLADAFLHGQSSCARFRRRHTT